MTCWSFLTFLHRSAKRYHFGQLRGIKRMFSVFLIQFHTAIAFNWILHCSCLITYWLSIGELKRKLNVVAICWRYLKIFQKVKRTKNNNLRKCEINFQLMLYMIESQSNMVRIIVCYENEGIRVQKSKQIIFLHMSYINISYDGM